MDFLFEMLVVMDLRSWDAPCVGGFLQQIVVLMRCSCGGFVVEELFSNSILVTEFEMESTGENDSKTFLDAFFLGKALGEALTERIESTFGELLSTVGWLQAEQQKQVQEFQENGEAIAKKVADLKKKEMLLQVAPTNALFINNVLKWTVRAVEVPPEKEWLPFGWLFLCNCLNQIFLE